MRSKLIPAVLILIAFSPASLAQRNYDPQSVALTRWIDTTTRPITYEEYIASRNFASSANIKLLKSPLATTGEPIDIFVNEDLYPLIAADLEIFFLDLQLDGYSLNLYTILESLSPVSLRNTLYNDWLAQNISGAILIGDTPIAWYEMYEPWDSNHVQFPCDLYFMDLDGAWIDADTDGMYDEHSGSLYADIWIGRLLSSRMHDHGINEVTALQNYFSKNHEYRAGDFRLNDHALAFIDNDWNPYGWGFDVALAYAGTDSVVDIYETSRANYINYVSGINNNRYEHVLICSHSSPFAHYIYYDLDNYQLFRNYEIETNMMQALSFNLFACSNSRFVENDNMGGWYIFQSEYGLISIGSTKTGSMLCFDDFYYPLGQGATFGQAFLMWAQMDMEACAGDDSRGWFYGMCLQGDPTIRLARFQEPLVYCLYVPGDINGDSLVQGSDVTFGVRFFRGIGSVPPDSCWDELTSDWLYVAGDVNGTCEFLGSDITYLVSYFRGVNDSLRHCERFPIGR